MRPLAVTPISPAGRENAYADDATGSGQQTTTGHATSGHGVPGIDPRIWTGHSETESPHAASGSGQKTATAPGASGHEKRAKRTTTGVDALDLLTANGKRSESDNHNDIHEQLQRDLALLSFHAPRSEDREPREDNTRWQDYEVSLEFSRRGTCGENWGETTKSEAREKGVYSERAVPTSPAPEREGEAGARPRRKPRGTSTPRARPRSSGRGGSPPQTKHQVHPEIPPASPALLRGGKKKKKKSQEAKLPKKFPRGEVGGAEGTEPEGREDVLRNVSTLLHKKFPLSRRPNSTNVTKHYPYT